MPARNDYPTTRWLQIFLVVLTCLVHSPAFSVEPRPGEIYPGGATIEVNTLGVKFTIPDQWQGALDPSGGVFLMEPPGRVATLFVIADVISADQTYAFLKGPVQLSNDLHLKLDGGIERNGNSFSAGYTVAFNPTLSAETRAKSGENGTSIAFFLVSQSTHATRLTSKLDKVFASLVLQTTGVQQTPNTKAENNDPAASDNSWLSYLKGKHIVRYFTTSGYTEEQHIWLCSNGNYVRRFDGGGFGGGASGAFQGSFDGTWNASGEGEHGQLILNASDGQAVYNLRWDYGNNRLYVDEKRWLHSKNTVCH